MNSTQKNFALLLIFVGIMFFAIGFALGVSSVLTPVLQGSLGITSVESYFIIAATLVPFLIPGYPASMTIKAIGYKHTMALSFVMSVIAFGLYIPSASQESFALFLVVSFASGTTNAFLQASVNPYVTTPGPLDSATKRISITGICNKLAWSIPPLLLVFLIGKEVSDITISDLLISFYIIIAAFILLGIISLMAPLPEVKAAGEDDSEGGAGAYPYVAGKMSVWQFPHLLLGCLALFLYVGVETISLGILADYTNNLHLENVTTYARITPIGVVIGYIHGIIFIPKYLNQATALKICSILTIAGSILVVLTPADISIYFIAFIVLGCSLMWPVLWPLVMTDLGKSTKAGSSLLIMAMAGSAVIPTLSGYIKDIAGAQNAHWICLLCLLFILYYRMTGYKIRTK